MSVNNTNRPFLIGATLISDGGGPTYPFFFFNGQLDEISAYNRAITPSEVSQIVAIGSGGKCSGTTPVPTPTPSPPHVGNVVLQQAVAAQEPDFSHTYHITGQNLGSLSDYHFLEAELNGTTVNLVENGTP